MDAQLKQLPLAVAPVVDFDLLQTMMAQGFHLIQPVDY